MLQQAQALDQLKTMEELRERMGMQMEAARWLVEVPLASALEFLRIRGLKGHTLCPQPDEVRCNHESLHEFGCGHAKAIADVGLPVSVDVS